MHGFWKKLKKPFLALAPMYDVTDAAFRQIIGECGKPDVMFTEFVSVDGLLYKDSGTKITDLHLTYEEDHRPIVAQVFGSDPELFYRAAKVITDLGFDGVDINMGCPDKAVIKSGAGSALIKDFTRAREIVEATKEGTDIPLSVKTRIGFSTDITEEWIDNLLSASPAAITVHGRTKKEMSKVPAHWDAIQRAAQCAKGSGTLIVGNGDVTSVKEAKEKAARYGVDGVMIGRGVFSNPWVFMGAGGSKVNKKQKIALLVRHAELFETYFKKTKRFDDFKKHIKHYINGFDGAKELREQLMKAASVKELITITKENI